VVSQGLSRLRCPNEFRILAFTLISPHDDLPAMSQFTQTRRVFVAVLIVGWFALASRNVVDPDVWWHLKTGEYIAVHKVVPHVDIFSFTKAGQPWVAHEWLSDLLIYGIYRAAGWGGLITVFAAIVSAAFFLLFLRCARSTYVSGVMTLWGAWATAPLWGVRPQTVSLLLVSLWLLILERSERRPNLLWWTLLLTVLWVNLHAGFALGLVLLALFLVGEVLELIFSTQSLLKLGTRPLSLAVALVLNLLFVPLNPNGTKMYFYPIATLRSPAMQKYIAEWASPNFHQSEYAAFLFLLLATVAALAWTRIRVRLRDLLLLLVSILAALSSVRMIPIFVLIAMPILSRAAQSIFVRSRLSISTMQPQRSPHRSLPFIQLWNALIFAGLVIFASVHLVEIVRQQPKAEASRFPAGAVAYLYAHPVPGPIFNHYDWGGYLIWTDYPQVCVFIDGRADVYGEHLFDQFADAYQLKKNWPQVLDEWKIHSVIIPPNSALALALRHVPNWSVRYQDFNSIVLSQVETPESRQQNCSGNVNYINALR
jgi:hypothetical protein